MVLYAIDCEMNGGVNGSTILARVSIVDENGTVVLDNYVKPNAVVTQDRRRIHGITLAQLKNGVDFNTVQQKVKRIIDGSILIGHSLAFDLKALRLTHPKEDQRDLADYKIDVWGYPQTPSLRFLANIYLDKHIQDGYHDSVEDARATMEIYKINNA